MTRVAVLGAGFQGACIALELARRGVAVDLFDREDRPVTRAGLWNEGKVHLGFVYGNDPTGATAERMVEGAMVFRRALARWIEFGPELCSPTPFVYGVHRDSMLSVGAVREHFARVERLVAEHADRGGDYLGERPESLFSDLSRDEWTACFDPRRIQSALRTVEQAVDTVEIARRLRSAIATSEAIAWRPRQQVVGVTTGAAESTVAIRPENGGEVETRRYRSVVNALWEGRPAIDRSAGVTASRSFFHRLKYGVWLDGLDGAAPSFGRLPSTTLVLGPFGDIVRLRQGRLYLSWYPSGRVAVSGASSPPHWPVRPSESVARGIVAETLAALAEICPAVGEVDATSSQVRGGPIVALGESDIDRADSGLHRRSDVEPVAAGSYVSVPTGKYTLAPRYALQVADLIAPSRR